MIKQKLNFKLILINILLNAAFVFSFAGADETGVPEKKFRHEASGYIESGSRSVSEDYREEDNDAGYAFTGYHVKFKQELSERFGYDISAFKYVKDYDTSDDMDNKSRIFKTNLLCRAGDLKDKTITLGIKIQYKEKGYYNSPEREFSQFVFSPALKIKKEGLYALDFFAGLNKYDYVVSSWNDQVKYFAGMEGRRYFLKSKLVLSEGYGVEHLNHKQDGRDRTKQNLMSGIEYIFKRRYLDRIETKFKWGKSDTKDEDERDDDSDYRYKQYNAKTIHKINDKLKTDIKYDYFIKDYKAVTLDHKGFFIANGYDFEISDSGKQRLWLNFDIGRKDVKYGETAGNNYKKMIYNLQLNLDRRKNWKTSFGVESSLYEYDDEEDNKKRYCAKLSGEKFLFDSRLELNMDFKYRLNDYKQKLDEEQESLRLGASYEF